MSDNNKVLNSDIELSEKKVIYKYKKLSDDEIAEYLKGSILIPKTQ